MNRPKPQPQELSNFDKTLEFLTIAALLFSIFYTAVNYAGLPETIPTHFDSNGNPDSYGNKIMIWLAPAISIVICLGLIILNKYPHYFNYLVKITPENAQRQYLLAQSMLRKLNLLIALMFLFVTYSTIKSTQSETGNIDTIIITYSVAGIFIILIHYLIQSSKKLDSNQV